MVRLYFLFISAPLQQTVDSCRIIPAILSDHSAVVLKIIQNNSEKGVGFWKLNTSLLENNDYVQTIEQIIDEQTNQNYETVRLTWEMIKLQTRGESIKFTARPVKSNVNKLEVLECKLKETEQIMNNTTEHQLVSIQNNAVQQLALNKKDMDELLTI